MPTICFERSLTEFIIFMKLNDRDLDTLVLAAVDLILKWNTCLMPHNLGPIGLEGDLVVG